MAESFNISLDKPLKKLLIVMYLLLGNSICSCNSSIALVSDLAIFLKLA